MSSSYQRKWEYKIPEATVFLNTEFESKSEVGLPSTEATRTLACHHTFTMNIVPVVAGTSLVDLPV